MGIIERRKANPLITGALRPGEETAKGVMCGIDAVGYQAKLSSDPARENPTEVLDQLVEVIIPTGRLWIVGVYIAPDPGGVNRQAKQGEYPLPWAKVFEKAITIGTGQTPVKRYMRDLIIAGRARPSRIVSHRLPLSAAPEAYEKFDRRTDGYTKVILKPQWQRGGGAQA